MPFAFSQSIRCCTWAITSGPIPSPGSSSSLWVAIMIPRYDPSLWPARAKARFALLPGHGEVVKTARSANAPEGDWQVEAIGFQDVAEGITLSLAMGGGSS